MTIKAIETEYNGYKFRSRLEARWAVFFDAAGIDYKYEPEGFQLPQVYSDAKGYLPDFYLPEFGVYAEIKGSDEELQKDAGKICDAIDFCSTPVSCGLVILGDIPYKDPFYNDDIPVFRILSHHKGVVAGYCSFYYAFKCRDVFCFLRSADDYYGGDEPFGKSDMLGDGSLEGVSTKCEWWDLTGESYIVDTYRTMWAYKTARQARFEHGETPVIAHD